MSGSYYYLVAQLPGLRFGREPGLAPADFLAEAGKWLSRSALETIRGAVLFDRSDEPSGCTLLDRFKAFERSFREELRAWRQARLEGREQRTSFPPAWSATATRSRSSAACSATAGSGSRRRSSAITSTSRPLSSTISSCRSWPASRPTTPHGAWKPTGT